MVAVNECTCPKCGEELKQLGYVKRIFKMKGGDSEWMKIRRLLCNGCGMVHRELPAYIFPYKHYDAEIIKGVLNGTITSNDLDYEDYPCEMTMRRWQEVFQTKI